MAFLDVNITVFIKDSLVLLSIIEAFIMLWMYVPKCIWSYKNKTTTKNAHILFSNFYRTSENLS